MNYFEFKIRIPYPSRRFSLRGLLVFTAVVAVGLELYIQTAQYKATALLMVSHRPSVPLSADYDYHEARSSILDSLQSEQVILAGLRRTGKKQSIAVSAIRSRMDIRVIGNSELVSVSLCGRKFRDNKKTFIAILDGIVQEVAVASTNDATEVVVRLTAAIR